MLELLFLLLPVAAAYGWYMGRRSSQQDKQQNANRLSREYVAGVNFLLSNQQDKAVDLFLDMLKEDSNTVEAHLTLGNLFRSRGEVDRAIRIHQSLMESASLTFEQRLLAVQQLGRDYMAAGFYDRAEDMFNQLVKEEDFQLFALQQLLIIHQATSDWQSAIEVAEKLIKLGKTNKRQEIAHFYCELALQAMSSDDLDKASGLLKKAASADKLCARVSIMQGRILLAQAEYGKAAEALKRVLEQDKEVVSETLPMLQECYQHLDNRLEWAEFLKRCVDENTGATAELMLAEILQQEEGREVAQLYINRQLQRHPTMRVFHHLMDYHLADAEEGRAKESLVLLRDMVGEQIRTKPRYRCHKCGFTAHSLYWHCPSCRAWATVKPIRGLDGQ
ncbi:lipopolysaccharide assembly protein LapB [Rouxiella badensis]|jgi:lipopolysaccharide biosynthesis regulator YciM|uniref:Lipopolysaccharide assembly protein B n=1 Tax=Rouxiella badensis TaxID=1646377 RepID=A0A1X0W9E5_9GAMM|nr:lipopolysaccharide assembly protein LapB [Rouxiella badensis]MCC3701499.1 lipopolysaccharide assembly protein LapB [Rouxiella badensis]MCC3717926.1 lipopolysaccharide assembly protein LapB [Rouxiella badensis]MCC3730059.1 lipopolysaccharide assembly protein LapB [Rouxiella badensis]MCC3734232.1 lipopolysaccharide assembly protein LapB [Rouxiella badensis]MCC3739269.1 lipopolysaccharide assembly protein LapB [Rouxiella badensis]